MQVATDQLTSLIKTYLQSKPRPLDSRTPTTKLFNTPLPRLAKVSNQQRRCGRSSTRGPFAATDRQQQGTNKLTNQPTKTLWQFNNYRALCFYVGNFYAVNIALDV